MRPIELFRTLMLALSLMTGWASEGAAVDGTLSLDSLSFISFDDKTTTSLSGGRVQFIFGTVNKDGSIPFEIDPTGVVFSPIAVPGADAPLQYRLSSRATGLMVPTATGQQLSFTGSISVQDQGGSNPGTRNYSIHFSTEAATATRADGAVTVSRQGARIPGGARYVQLVGATVNKSENQEGAAVYVVLSGSFDQLPR